MYMPTQKQQPAVNGFMLENIYRSLNSEWCIIKLHFKIKFTHWSYWIFV